MFGLGSMDLLQIAGQNALLYEACAKDVDSPVCRSSTVFWRALILWIVVLAAGVRPAAAQGLGSFISPGKLAEPHAKLEGITQCTQCHEPGRGLSAARCLACHDHVRSQVESGTGYHATLGETCERCHSDHQGRAFDMVQLDEASFDHQPTGFPLRGAHAEAPCKACHTDPRDCHEDPHGADQSHRTLLAGCGACHEEESWRALPIPTSVFDHQNPAHADFPLEGAHREVACDACHLEWRFVPVAAKDCTSCHENPHRTWLGACTDCHTVAGWSVGTFDHDRTRFPLEGLHQAVACTACHGSDTTRRLPHDTCEDCHEDPHQEQFAPRGCDACHSVDIAAFGLADFDHDATGYPLRGHHAEVACEACHGEGPEATWAGLPAEDCATCHEDPHQAHFEPTPCATCHQENGWLVEDFDHERTDFPLDGAHAGLTCETCHAERWTGIAHASCLDCHQDDDPHGEALAGDTCATCHVTSDWEEVHFDHDQRTAFVLGARHADLTCTECHQRPDYSGLSGRCESCHLDRRPAGHYTGDCAECHPEVGWTPAGFGERGHAVTGFALHGTHAQLECVECHQPGDPKGVAPSSCEDCHASDDPHRHLLGDRCEDCHEEVSWYRTTWRHSRTGWPLRGGHKLAYCTDCHATGYAGTPRDCWRCHEAEAPMDIAAHQSPFFHACEDCHHVYTWSVTTYPH